MIFSFSDCFLYMAHYFILNSSSNCNSSVTTLKNICLDNVLDFVGTNTVAAHWDIDLTNRDGKEIQNNGITVIKIKFGKALYVKDFLFDTGPKWRAGWGVE